MLTVKIIDLDGLENIAETSKAQYSPQYNYIGLDEGGMEIPAGATAYIMNSNGKTISRHVGPDVVQVASMQTSSSGVSVTDECGDERVRMNAIDVEEEVVTPAEFRSLLEKNRPVGGWKFIDNRRRSITVGNKRYIES